MVKSQTLKAIVLSLGLAALMAPATMNAQINRGLLQNPYKQDNSQKNTGMMNPNGNRGVDGSGLTVLKQDFGAEAPSAPLGSGIAILIGAGLGYVALKKKEDEQ